MRIYTRQGDKGMTRLADGVQLAKDDMRVETYGYIDELNSHIGLISDHFDEPHTRSVLKEIQDRLFTIGSWFGIVHTWRNSGFGGDHPGYQARRADH